MKILLSMPDTLGEKLQKFCDEHDLERSEFVRQLIRERIMPDLVRSPQVSEEVSTVEPEYIPEKVRGWCEGHFEKGKEYELTHVVVEDNNGAVILDKKVCESCLVKFAKHVERNGGKITKV